MKEKWELIGEVGVDSGTIMICDPCYWIDSQEKKFTWKEWCKLTEKLGLFKDGFSSIPYDLGHEGRGVVIGSFGGDGTYGVYVKRKGLAIQEMKIVFNNY